MNVGMPFGLAWIKEKRLQMGYDGVADFTKIFGKQEASRQKAGRSTLSIKCFLSVNCLFQSMKILLSRHEIFVTRKIPICCSVSAWGSNKIGPVWGEYYVPKTSWLVFERNRQLRSQKMSTRAWHRSTGRQRDARKSPCLCLTPLPYSNIRNSKVTDYARKSHWIMLMNYTAPRGLFWHLFYHSVIIDR